MTDLEYIICEAESAGEIDLDTRDELLGTLYESISLQRNQKKLDDNYGRKMSDLNDEKRKLDGKLSDAIDRANKPIPGKRKSRADRKKIKQREQSYKDNVDNIKGKIDQLSSRTNNTTKKYLSKSSNYHKSGSNPVESLSQGNKVRNALNKNNSHELDNALYNGTYAKNAVRDAYYKDDRRAMDKRLDKYGTVESTETEVDVDDIRKEIYERELTGEITIEEREALLDYLDSQLIED